jgi:hypothetical protein
MTCGADYVLAQADIDAGRIDLTVAAAGASPGSRAVGGLPATTVEAPPDETRVAGAHLPKLTLVKSSSVSDPSQLVAGATITYTFVVANAGNVTMSGVEVVEKSFTGTGALSAVVCPNATLAPGEEMSCTATYRVTQADHDSGKLDNTAEAGGQGPTPADGSAPVVVARPVYTASIPAAEAPSLSLVKTALGPVTWAAGQEVAYAFVVTNDGDVTVDGIEVEEVAFTGAKGAAPTVSCPITNLAPGESTTCEASYALTAEDLAQSGEIANTAKAVGTTALGRSVASQESTASVAVPAPPAVLAWTGLGGATGLIALECLGALLAGLVLLLAANRRRRKRTAR